MKKVFSAVALMLGLAIIADAQTAIRNEQMSQDGTNVTVSMEIDTDDTDLPARRKEVIMPYIYNGSDTLFLEVVEVYGKGRFKRERQINAINGDKEWNLAEGQVMKNAGIYRYESQVPLKRWMKSAILGVRRQIVGCACENDLDDKDLAQAALFQEPQVQRRLPAFALTEVSRRWDMGQDELEIVFKVSKAEIDSSVFENEVTFGKILDAVDKIHRNPQYKIEKLHIAGYASPEGPKGFNTWLGINRAKALANYIIEHRPEYGLTEANFEIHNGEENWSGLRKVLSESKAEYKDEVIKVIDAEMSSESKKRMIKSMKDGQVWDDMLKEIYPRLRNAKYISIYYDSTDDRLAEIVKQANQLITEGRYNEAYELASGCEDDARASGTIGLSLMMQKKFEEAMPWLQKALEGGCQASRTNIDAINAEYEWEEQQRKEIEEYLKKYE